MTGTVLTLDAGGTTFSFHAINGPDEISEPLVLPARGDDLKACIDTMIHGFEEIRKRAKDPVVAISFAFPGPADYPNGVIGDLGNLPAFRGGVPLGPLLSGHFNLPVFINNDGNLFALGEARGGLLPRVNSLLQKAGQTRHYRNLLAVTLGTGFGGGIVIDGQLLIGDCSAAGEIWLLRHKLSKDLNAEEGVSIRSVKAHFGELTGRTPNEVPEPRLIADYADDKTHPDHKAARESFRRIGEVLGDALANALTLVDGAVVIGGGLAGAARHFLPAVMAELNGRINNFPRLESTVYNLEDPAESESFVQSGDQTTAEGYPYVAQKKIPLGISTLGTSRAVAIGAYYFALGRLTE